MITDAGYAGRLETTLKLHIVYTPKTGYILDVVNKNAQGLNCSLFQVSGETLPHAFNLLATEVELSELDMEDLQA